LSEADKVLVVERVIEFLGLQTVRTSLVGTVEKRGISGGQRKKVNVGLEMVMEPSLLILDEPTSGLDSASSLHLLKALRREALEGVNICMVVHQPRLLLQSHICIFIEFQMFCSVIYTRTKRHLWWARWGPLVRFFPLSNREKITFGFEHIAKCYQLF
jgi:ABC-type cobalamin/Fe3+-siderophores transport system ATPase subunit